MSSEALERVERALGEYGSTQRGSMWNCPGSIHARGDMNRSLSVRDGNTGVVFKCHLGCDTREIVNAIGLTMAELFFEPLDPPREVARYHYLGVDHTTLYAKVRYEPKTFRVMHPTMMGTAWDWGLGGVQPVLYRLPEVKAAVAMAQTIYIVEGEKDADRLAERGYIATCNFDGASRDDQKPKWREAYSDELAGAKTVVIIADRDVPGVAHAKAVRDSLQGRVGRVRIVQTPIDKPGADVSDHLDQGLDVSELVPLEGTGIKTLNLATMMIAGVPEPEFLPGTQGMIYKDGIHGIAGPPDCGKTTLALGWAAAIMKEGGTVAFLDEEGGPEITVEKLASLGADPGMLTNLVYAPFPGKSWNDDETADLFDLIRDSGADLLLIDSAAAILARAGLDENSAADCTKFWAKVLTPIAKELHCAVLIIDHDTKASEGSRYARGSGAKLAATEVQFKVERIRPFTRDQEGILKFLVTKDRRGTLHLSWRVHVKTGGGQIVLDWQTEVVDENDNYAGEQREWPPARQSLYKAMDGEFRTRNHLVDRMVAQGGYPLRRETASRELNALEKDGYAERLETSPGCEALWKKVVPDPLITGLTCEDHGFVTPPRDQDPLWTSHPRWSDP